MGFHIEWTERAVENLKSIEDYILADSEIQAKKVSGEIITYVDLLEDFPMMGRVVPEFPDLDLRELIKYSYRIIYSVEGNQVYIVTIIHGKRDFKAAFLNDK